MAPPDDEMRASPAMSEFGELSAGSVVFALPHIRDAIFEYHASVTLEQKARALARVPRRMSDLLWANLSGSGGGSYYCTSHSCSSFAYRANCVAKETSFLQLTQRLGLSQALWIDVILSRPLDASAWLIAFSHYRKSTSLALDASPYSRQGSGNVFEHPAADPLEMLLYGVTGGYYERRNWRPSDLLGKSFTQIFRDNHGHLFIARLADSRLQPFLLQASQRCAALLYSTESPIFPVKEVVPWSAQHDVAVYIWRMPPWPLSRSLAIGQESAAELRRILERARDLFAHLVTLQKYGVSLDIQKISHRWPANVVAEGQGPTILPAYLSPFSSTYRARKAATEFWIEQLPDAPPRAWPMTPLGNGRGDAHCLPWSQSSAYADQRVEGPRLFFFGITSVSWDEAAATERRGSYMGGDELTRVLERDIISDAYDAWHEASIECLPQATSEQLSKLFTTCYSCLLSGRVSGPPTSAADAAKMAKGICSICSKKTNLVVTIPSAMRQLLLRIARPGKLQDGTDDIVTAKEALDVMNGVLESEIPRLQSFFERWVDAQDEVPRLTTPVEVRLPLVLGDDRAHRWVELEMLRGNYLDEKFNREEFNKMRDFIKNDLTPLQKQKRDEFRIACGDVVGEGDEATEEEEGAEEAPTVQQPPKRGRRSAAAAASMGAGGSNDATEEAESSSSGTKKGAKRGGGSSSKGSTAKKAKKKK